MFQFQPFSTKYAKAKKVGGDPMSPKARSTVAEPASDEAAAKKKKKKSKSKKRLPKNLNIEPDPERWIPKRERTGYRKPKRNRRKGDEKFVGAQGTATGAADAFDYSQKKVSSATESPKPEKSEPTPGPRQQQRKPQAKKKSKSGKNRF